MSAEVLQRLTQEGTLTMETLADLFNIEKHSCYPYLVEREMRYGQVRTLCRRSIDPRVAAAFFNDLMRGTGWCPIYIEADLDFDGDGDVDTNDAIGYAVDAMGELSKILKKVVRGGNTDLAELADLKQRVLQGVVSSVSAVAHVAANKPTRRKAKTAGGAR